jgi:spermidine synthase
MRRVVIVDFPDPSNYSLGKLYEAHSTLQKNCFQSNMLVIQTTSPLFCTEIFFWCINKTLIDAYHAYVPSFGGLLC